MSALSFVAGDPMPSGITVADVVGRYLAFLDRRCQAGAYSAQALESATRDLHRFAAQAVTLGTADHREAPLGTLEVAQCRQHHLTRFLDENPQWKSGWTVQRVVGEIIACFKWAADEDLTGPCPFRVPRSLRFMPKRDRRDATQAEYVALMKAGSRALRRILFFLRRTGCRTCEARELLWDWIDLGNGFAEWDRHKTANQTEIKQSRLVAFDAGTLRFLRNLYRTRPRDLFGGHDPHVFLNSRGKAWDRHVLARNFRRLADRLGVAADLSAYCLRHLFGTNVILGGGTEREAADMMGHVDTRMMRRYAHTAQKREHLARLAEEIMRKRRRDKGP